MVPSALEPSISDGSQADRLEPGLSSSISRRLSPLAGSPTGVDRIAGLSGWGEGVFLC